MGEILNIVEVILFILLGSMFGWLLTFIYFKVKASKKLDTFLKKNFLYLVID